VRKGSTFWTKRDALKGRLSFRPFRLHHMWENGALVAMGRCALMEVLMEVPNGNSWYYYLSRADALRLRDWLNTMLEKDNA